MKPFAGALFGMLFSLSVSGAACADDGDVRCLRSVGPNKPIRLEFGFPAGNSAHGYVLYQHGSAKIPVKSVRSESVETAPGRPFEFTTTWQEMTPGGGRYTVVSQGARIYGFTFVRARDGKTFEFAEDEEAYGDKGCVWRRR